MGRGQRNTPELFVCGALEDCAMAWRRTAIRQVFPLNVTLCESLWRDTSEVGQRLTLAAGGWLEIEVYRVPVIRMFAPLTRLRDAQPPLAAFVYYAFADGLGKLLPIYDWRDAAAQYAREYDLAMGAGPRAARDTIQFDAGDPAAEVPDWLREPRRLTLAEAGQMADEAQDAWVRKTTYAAIDLVKACQALQPHQVQQYPTDELSTVTTLARPKPLCLLSIGEMDQTEGMGRELLRALNVPMRSTGPAKQLRPGAACIRIDAADPRTGMQAFGDLCEALYRAAMLVRLFTKARRRGRAKVRVRTDGTTVREGAPLAETLEILV
jgi:hypothetical protein